MLGNRMKRREQRMEFVGDAVITLVVRELVYKKYPHATEGDLTKMVSQVVSNKNLARFSDKRNCSTKQRADEFEIRVGRRYLDLGFLETKQWLIDKLGLNKIKNFKTIDIDYKSVLQQLVQTVDKTKPKYSVHVEGDGETHFEIKCKCLDTESKGRAITRKEAERAAARHALKRLKRSYEKKYPKLFSNLKL